MDTQTRPLNGLRSGNLLNNEKNKYLCDYVWGNEVGTRIIVKSKNDK